DVRRHTAHRLPGALPRCQGSAAGDAQKGTGLVLFLEQFELAARQEADDGPVAVLSAGHDAHARAGADRGVLRARRARRQYRHRRLDRLARQPRPAAKPEPPRSGAQPDQDRRGVLLSPHPGQVVLDARAATDTVRLKTELLTLEAVPARVPAFGTRCLSVRAG